MEKIIVVDTETVTGAYGMLSVGAVNDYFGKCSFRLKLVLWEENRDTA
jgi:hypothetical protein